MTTLEIIEKLRALEAHYDQAWEQAINEAIAGEWHGMTKDEHTHYCNGLLSRGDVVRECIAILTEEDEP